MFCSYYLCYCLFADLIQNSNSLPIKHMQRKYVSLSSQQFIWPVFYTSNVIHGIFKRHPCYFLNPQLETVMRIKNPVMTITLFSHLLLFLLTWQRGFYCFLMFTVQCILSKNGTLSCHLTFQTLHWSIYWLSPLQLKFNLINNYGLLTIKDSAYKKCTF